ncbi:hypothetical protein AMTRI_Chr12g239030 [Amborella trichopoda]
MGGSECSSACESGWTMYLDQSLGKPIPHTLKTGDDRPKTWSFVEREEQEEEESLSMVSDASSGPPLQNLCACDGVNNGFLLDQSGKRRRIGRDEKDPSSILEDTASSPVSSLPKSGLTLTNDNNLECYQDAIDFSQGFSTTHLKERAQLQSSFGLFSTKPICREESRRQR